MRAGARGHPPHQQGHAQVVIGDHDPTPVAWAVSAARRGRKVAVRVANDGIDEHRYDMPDGT